NLGEITELAGCDLLTIAPALLEELQKGQGTLPRKLDPAAAAKMGIDRIVVDEAAFKKMHAEDKMASDKLDEGIKGFTKAIVTLEKMLSERLEALNSPERAKAKSTAAGNLFKVYDMDGDGFITREEWGGTDAVFDAMDTDHDGRIGPEEIAAGLGASIGS